jgi:hypothetical protein
MKRASVPILLALLASAAVAPYAFPALARFEPHFKIVAIILWVCSYCLVVWPLRFGPGTPVSWRNLLIPWILQKKGPPLTWKDVALLSVFFTSIIAILMAEHDGQDHAPMRLGALAIFAGSFAGAFILSAAIASPKESVGDSKAIRYRCIPGEGRPLR